MHSCIIELTKKPVDPEDRMDQYTFEEDSQVQEFSDYITDSENRAEDIENFLKSLPGGSFDYNATEQSITFLPEFQELYFQPRLRKLQLLVRDMTLDDFTDAYNGVYQLKHLIEDVFDYHVYNDDALDTLDAFLRYLEAVDKYYIGGIVGYHA
jgi:hypothetical protein